ncbi:metal ABC transporter solute-binding protein, Zn/Mn family [Porticoccus sp. GXU_MW_L64]
MVRLLIATLLVIASYSALAANTPPLRVVTTIKPLTMIAEDIAGDRVVISQLIPAGSSSHGYAMKVSDRRTIQQADVLLWIGETMDGFVGKIATDGQASIAADQLRGITWPTTTGHHHHNHSGGDPHIWLNPDNVIIIASELATRLGKLDPANRAHYQQAAERFRQQIQAFDKQAQERLAQLPNDHFVVQHDAYGHFISRYGLSQLGSLRSISGTKAGAKTMSALLNKKGEGTACLLTDPQFDAKAANTFSARTGVKQTELDPLGHQVAAKPGELNYRVFLDGFVEAFQECLAVST